MTALKHYSVSLCPFLCVGYNVFLLLLSSIFVLNLQVMSEWGLRSVYSPALFDRALNKFMIYFEISVHLLELTSALLLPLLRNFFCDAWFALWTFLQPLDPFFQKNQLSVEGFEKFVFILLNGDLSQVFVGISFGFWIGKELTFKCGLPKVGLEGFRRGMPGAIVSEYDNALGLELVFWVDGIRIFCFLNFHNFYSWI